MKNINKEKLAELKREKGLTIREISDASGLTESSLAKIFAGVNDNPTIDTLKKIAVVLDCIVDDFLTSNKENYYEDRKTAAILEEINSKPEFKMLLDASRNLDVSDLNAVCAIVQNIKKQNLNLKRSKTKYYE